MEGANSEILTCSIEEPSDFEILEGKGYSRPSKETPTKSASNECGGYPVQKPLPTIQVAAEPTILIEKDDDQEQDFEQQSVPELIKIYEDQVKEIARSCNVSRRNSVDSDHSRDQIEEKEKQPDFNQDFQNMLNKVEKTKSSIKSEEAEMMSIDDDETEIMSSSINSLTEKGKIPEIVLEKSEKNCVANQICKPKSFGKNHKKRVAVRKWRKKRAVFDLNSSRFEEF